MVARSVVPRLRPHVRLQWNQPRQRYVLLGPENVMILNETGAAIVSFCDGNHSIETILAHLSSSYENVSSTQVHDFIRRLVEKDVVALT